jgi:hypothetical protein
VDYLAEVSKLTSNHSNNKTKDHNLVNSSSHKEEVNNNKCRDLSCSSKEDLVINKILKCRDQ